MSLNALGRESAEPVPTKVKNWQMPIPQAVLNGLPGDTPMEIFKADLGAATDDPAAPLLQRAAYEFSVNARTRGGITQLYFFIQLNQDDPAIQLAPPVTR